MEATPWKLAYQIAALPCPLKPGLPCRTSFSSWFWLLPSHSFLSPFPPALLYFFSPLFLLSLCSFFPFFLSFLPFLFPSPTHPPLNFSLLNFLFFSPSTRCREIVAHGYKEKSHLQREADRAWKLPANDPSLSFASGRKTSLTTTLGLQETVCHPNAVLRCPASEGPEHHRPMPRLPPPMLSVFILEPLSAQAKGITCILVSATRTTGTISESPPGGSSVIEMCPMCAEYSTGTYSLHLARCECLG